MTGAISWFGGGFFFYLQMCPRGKDNRQSQSITLEAEVTFKGAAGRI